MKTTTLLLLTLLLTGCSGQTVPVDSCVLVVTEHGHGSGVIIGPGTVLTAWHVAKNATSITLQDGTSLPVVCIQPAEMEDAALLFVDGNTPPPVPVSLEPLRVDDEIVTVGTPFNLQLQGVIVRGRIVATNRPITYPLDPKPCMNDLADLNVGPGISGGPVFRDDKVVGIVVGIVFTYAAILPIVDFKELLNHGL
jgi:S1-C subfamily serine protease